MPRRAKGDTVIFCRATGCFLRRGRGLGAAFGSGACRTVDSSPTSKEGS